MISGTSYSPSKTFVEFARDFFESLAKNDYGAALGGLDARGKQWNRQKLASSIRAATGAQGLSTCIGITQSASPTLTEIGQGVYSLQHRLPVAGKWAKPYAVFLFTQKLRTGYFSVTLEEICY
ncbi:hypothetical protein FHW83_005572 [Duganella sp. SG902]|uniref:hypothetical protein n=1 Tax=Duganella sp. SG902 TaxID=2587016 RepID=UPI00159D1E35|nr:hypothetical protein [Duganella sp. SG902]NVM79731.1 hypothetical protein [Duganella sp. SG902]